MKGDRRPSIGLSTSKKMLHNYTPIPRDGTRRVDEGSAYQARKYRRSQNVLPPGRDGQVDKLAAGAEIFTAFGLYTSLHSWKGTAVAVRRGGRSRVGSDVN